MAGFGLRNLLVGIGISAGYAFALPCALGEEVWLPPQQQAKKVPTGAKVELYLADRGRTIHLHPGQTIAVKLVGCDDALNFWRLKPLGWFSPLKEGKAPQKIYSEDQPAIGGSPTTVFYLKATRTGTERVRFEYRRDHDANLHPLNADYTFSVDRAVR